MRCAVCLLICLVGCEQMEDPGGFSAITQPVDVAPTASGGAPAAEPALTFEEPVVIDSADIQDQAPAPEPVAEPVAEPAPVIAELEPVEGESMIFGEEPSATTTVVTQGGFPDASGWPLRLVKTLPDTNPPRAVLGLPNGEEIVVTPGKMIPDHNLVVMSIGPTSAELARISPDGDHANVQPVSLQTQY